MKTILKTGLFLLAAGALASCGGNSNSSSSSSLFGPIPGIIENYDSERDALESNVNENNFKENSEKIDKLKEETIAKLTKEGEALNGKELPAAMNEAEMKAEQPLTLVYDNVSTGGTMSVVYKLDGKVVAANDLTLTIDPADLKGETLLSGSKVDVTVTLPVQIEFLDKEGNVVDTRTIGRFPAENNGETAVIKAGTPIELQASIPVGVKYAKVESARLTIDLSKGLASRHLGN